MLLDFPQALNSQHVLPQTVCAMLSADISVLNEGLPDLDDRFKLVILFFVQVCPALLSPFAVINAGRVGKYLRLKSPKSAASSGPSAEVQKKVQAVLEVKKLSTCRTLIDYCSMLSGTFVVFVWIKSMQFGIATIPAFDLCLIPLTLLWLIFVATFQADLLPKSRHTVTVMAISYNLLLVFNQVLCRYLSVTDRDVMLIICRFFAGFIFCDHRKAALSQLIFVFLKAQAPPHVSNRDVNEIWDVLLWELFQQVVFIAPMWVSWFAIEYFVKQFTELMVQSSDVNASLEAARSVLASQCDAEAGLREEKVDSTESTESTLDLSSMRPI